MLSIVVRQDFALECLAKAKPLRPRPRPRPAYCKAKVKAKATKFGLKAKD